MWRKSLVARTKSISAPTALPTFQPILAKQGRSVPLFLSPDGKWFARNEGGTLTIRATRTGAVAFTDPGAGKFIGWVPSSVSFVTTNGDMVSVYSPAVRKPGGGSPGLLWQPTVTAFPPGPGVEQEGLDQENLSLTAFQMGSVAFSPDMRYAVKGSWDKGQVVWEVADLIKGKVAPPVMLGNWLNYSPKVGTISEVGIAVAPANLATQGKPLVALVQTTDLFNKPSPQPTPTAHPVPTPTYTSLQLQIKSKEEREDAELQALAEKVEGVDGSDPVVTDPVNVARIGAEIKRRSAALQAERSRVFPVHLENDTRGTVALDSSETLRHFQIECFSLGAKKRLWTAKLNTVFVVPGLQFSPDGRSLVAWKTAAHGKTPTSIIPDEIGIEFRSPSTGQLIKKANLYEGRFGVPDVDQVVFYDDPVSVVNGKSKSVLVVKDRYHYQGERSSGDYYPPTLEGEALRFFDAGSGREVKHLRINSNRFDDKDFDIGYFSSSRTGQEWLLSTPNLFAVSEKELGAEHVGPFPVPTATPKPQMRHSPSFR